MIPSSSTPDHRKHPESSPTDTWICGRSPAVSPCLHGPDHRGKCRSSFQCIPVNKDNRWHCTRSHLYGGACETGPSPGGSCCQALPPCQPTRSLRAKRNLLNVYVSLFMVGFLLLVLPGPDGPSFINPGGLTLPHRGFENTCQGCHALTIDNAVSWLATGGSPARTQTDNKLCLTCHALGEYSLNVHGRFPQELALRTKQFQEQDFSINFSLSSIVSPIIPQPHQEGLSCGTCHQEHQGSQNNLTAMSNEKCQSCHVKKFWDLTDGHPELSDYPFQRPTRIVFNHLSHIEKHFTDEFREKAPTYCLDCHSPDRTGRTMLAGNFVDTCGGCHVNEIEGHGRADIKGIVFLRLPGLDIETLQEKNVFVGEWPENYNFGEGLTPFMELLLKYDTDLSGDVDIVNDLGDLTDLSETTDEEIQAVARVIWNIKVMLASMLQEGQEFINVRLQAMANKLQPLDPIHYDDFTGRLSLEVLTAAQHAWLPNLEAEIVQYRSGNGIPKTRVVMVPEYESDLAREEWVNSGGWFRQDADFTILYRPAGHADGFMRSWLDVSKLSIKNNAEASNKIFSLLADPKGPGLCTKCHRIESSEKDIQEIHWYAEKSEPNNHTVTIFSHTPHLSLAGPSGCQTCHIFKSRSEMGEGNADTNPRRMIGDFQPMAKLTCSRCHTSDQAGQRCTTCHSYHVGVIGTRPVESPLKVKAIEITPSG